jgi:hypothetical protein
MAPERDIVREIADLRAGADWYRRWAELAGSDDERQARFRVAEAIERQIRELLGPSDSDKRS